VRLDQLALVVCHSLLLSLIVRWGAGLLRPT
jgi:hypothetical protein